MTNYVHSQLFICGLTEDVTSFVETYNAKLDTNFIRNVIPLPKEAIKISYLGGQKLELFTSLQADGVDGAQLAYKVWGSKWINTKFMGFNLAAFKSDIFKIYEFSLETAWTSPTVALLKMSELHPELTFSIGSVEEQPSFAFASLYMAGKKITSLNLYEAFEFDDSNFKSESEYSDAFDTYMSNLTSTVFTVAGEIVWAESMLADIKKNSQAKREQQSITSSNNNFIY